ncbi:hypothetical protein EVA_10408 [gut metagenome]|uniref:Uncharacterized protein n=1 Tax=gut metagenome TaxID=749906 RepID=J9G2N4_9ZZZZ
MVNFATKQLNENILYQINYIIRFINHTTGSICMVSQFIQFY